MIFLFQCVALPIAILLALLTPKRKRSRLHGLSRRFTKLAGHKRAAVALCGLAGFAASASLSAIRGIPVPEIHDEFSYLLAADTFAHGRLTNPTHPMWRHFESFHIIHQPTYASKYPPAQGLILAFGQVVFGQPAVGIWISMGLMSAAACWMLQAWVPPRWALLGGLLVAVQTEFQLNWGYSYLGAGLAYSGGAFVLGAIQRLRQCAHVTSAIWLGIGLALLANTRPFEGSVVSAIAGLSLLPRLFGRKRWSMRTIFMKILLPLGAVLLPVAAGMAYYNQSVTGHFSRLPYAVHEEQYGIAPIFLISPINPDPGYRHEEMAKFHRVISIKPYMQLQRFSDWVPEFFERFLLFLLTYAQLTYSPLLLFLPAVCQRREMLFHLFLICTMLLVNALITWRVSVYGSPVGSLILLLLIQAMRRLRVCHIRERPAGRSLTTSMVVISIVSFGLLLSLQFLKRVVSDRAGWPTNRGYLLQQLEQETGKQLILVSYDERHSTLQEWVYNRADIDAAKVVWARSMTPEENRELMDYFKDRRVWALRVNAVSGIAKFEEVKR